MTDSHPFRRLIAVLSLPGLIWCGICGEAPAADSPAAVFRTELQPLFSKYCVRCHGSKSRKGEFRIDTLDPDLTHGRDTEHWQEVLNQLNDASMPPEGELQVSSRDLLRMTTWLEAELHSATQHRNSTGGRHVMRRMSRYEYQYTLQDLLGIALDYSSQVPGDLAGEDGLKTNAGLLGMSMNQMQSYLNVAEQALQEAIPEGPRKVLTFESRSISVARIRGQRSPKPPKGTQSRHIAPSPGFQKSSFVHDLPRKVTFDKRPFAGRFRISIRLTATASSDGRLPELTVQVGHRSSGDYDPKKIMGRQLVKASHSPQVVEFTGNIEDFPLGKKGAYYNGSGSHNVTHLSVWMWNTASLQSTVRSNTRLDDLDEPLLEILSVSLTGPLLVGYPRQVARDLLPGSIAHAHEVLIARRVLPAFLRRAYRRDITADEVARVLESFQQFRQLTNNFRSALRSTMATILISPEFLYLVETTSPDGQAAKPDAFELASRLSYFLWASMPDEELLSLASSGQLMQPDVLRTQVRRMRHDARFHRFVKHFCSQWLGMSALEHVTVNPAVHPGFSDEIRENLKQETLHFATHIFTQDLSCLNFLNSDFAILNQVVAEHYGIRGISGSHFRTVPITAGDHRGGVLTHGSLLLMGSDGTDSNPVYRGVWLHKRLFADPPPPPPPGVPALGMSSDRKTELTIKEQLTQHRRAVACARCHDRIDPWGMAFENYDATGRWRTKYRATGSGPRTPAAVVEPTGILPDGETIDGMPALQNYLLQHRSRDLARALARRITEYALGRQLEFSDKALLGALTDHFEQQDLRISTLIEQIVVSQAFLTK